jgi:hypothetical protein
VVPDMPLTFEPRLDILPESQRWLWPELDELQSDFVLYGGTGLAHHSDIAFRKISLFLSSGFYPDRLRSRLPFLRDLGPSKSEDWVHWKRDNLEGFVDRGEWVKVAFFGGLDNLQRV